MPCCKAQPIAGTCTDGVPRAGLCSGSHDNRQSFFHLLFLCGPVLLLPMSDASPQHLARLCTPQGQAPDAARVLGARVETARIVLAIDDLRFGWGCGKCACCLDIEQLHLQAGQSLFLHGPSGCGKSTLLSLMAGMLLPTQGRVVAMGRNWADMSAGRRDAYRAAHVGYIFQQFNLLPWLSVLDNVLLPCYLSPRRYALALQDASAGTVHLPAPEALKCAARQWLQRMGLDEALWQRPVAQLSVGQQQRVAAARALLGLPDLIIADEPTSALDDDRRDDFIALLLSACRSAGAALVLVSHDRRIARHFDRSLHLPDINRAARPATVHSPSVEQVFGVVAAPHGGHPGRSAAASPESTPAEEVMTAPFPPADSPSTGPALCAGAVADTTSDVFPEAIAPVQPRGRALFVRQLPRLALQSAWSRRLTLVITLVCMALATFMLLGVERLRHDLRSSFGAAISGTDLVVGARTGGVQLLLYSVFRTGAATNNIRYSSVQAIAEMPGVAWVVPLSLGDSHRGFPVLGTTAEYFTRYRYGHRQPLQMREVAQPPVAAVPANASEDAPPAAFSPFTGLYDAVIGAEVAERLGYRLGQRITLAHGSGAQPLIGADHADKPFTVTAILQRTGTPVDRTVHISLEAMEAIHIDWMGGAPLPGARISAQATLQLYERGALAPRSVTAALVGLKSRGAVFRVQRQVNAFVDEPLLAVLPGVVLDELWDALALAENALRLMAAMVGLVSLAALMAVILVGLEARRGELAVLRALGAGLRHITALLLAEGSLLMLLALLAGSTALLLALWALGPWLQSHWGIQVNLWPMTASQWTLLALLAASGLCASLLPAWRASRLALADGLRRALVT